MGYSKSELYGLWQGFRGQSNEVQMLMDFATCSKDEAQALIDDFETRLEVETLDGDHRGKEFRVEYGKPTKPKKTAKAAPNPKYQPFRERFPELSALLDNGKPPTGGILSTTLIDRETAAKIIEKVRENTEIK